MRSALALALLASIVSGCATGRAPVPPRVHPHGEIETAPAWLQAARAETVREIDALPGRFAQTVAALPKRVAARSDEGPLLDPAAAETAAALPPGPYHCRLIRLSGRAGFRSFAPDVCYVVTSADGIAFTKQAGETLIDGYLYPDDDRRLILLGARRRDSAPGKGRYGDDPAQDIGGIVERVSAFRWRLLPTRAGGGAAIDLYELVPVTPIVPGAKPVVPGD